MPKLSKSALYCLGSLAAAGVLVYQTFTKDHISISLAITQLTNSKWKNAVMLNAVFAVVLSIVSQLISFFFGEMREIERFDIIQSIKQKILSFAFIMIMLHDDLINSNLILMLLGVLAWSLFHWLVIKRSEYLIMENQSNYKGHTKISILFCILMVSDILLLQYFFEKLFLTPETQKSDRHLMALLGFEILILLLKIGSPFIKYFVNLIELLTLSHFERKSTLISISEFVFTVAALVSELWLFYFIYKTFGTPLHLILEAIESIMSLVKTTTKFINSIKLVRKMNMLPDVTEEDIKNIDSTCLICLHEITDGKKIPCGHIFHLSCLKGWIQGNVNQFCPKCKQPIKIDNLTSTKETTQENNEVNGSSTEKYNGNAFKLNNLAIMKLYTEILLSYAEKEGNQILNLSHEKKIKKIFTDILMAQESGKDLIGAVEFGLPRPAVSYKSPETEELIKKIKLVNQLVLSQYSTHPFFNIKNIPKDTEVKEEKGAEKKKEPEAQAQTVPKPTLGLNTKAPLVEEKKKEIPLGDKKEESPKLDGESEEVRRRRLLLEAAERRAQQEPQAETSPENKKTQ